jgi:hypothetical protein
VVEALVVVAAEEEVEEAVVVPMVDQDMVEGSELEVVLAEEQEE